MATSELVECETIAEKAEPEYFVRFSVNQRVQHILLMVSFTVLAVTGLAQRFSDAGWGSWVILGLGGIDYTRLIHRGFGLLFTLIMLYHFGYVGYALFGRHARPTMVPSLKDFRDVVNTIRYSFGFAEKPPQFDRFDFNQKFEYWGLMVGGMVIIVTGFILAFPIAVTRFLPGQLVAASVDFHGFEATLAVITIVLWHLYDVIFKPGIFPADTSIFTSKISKKRMMEEHALEYAELTGGHTGAEAAEIPEDVSPSGQPPE